MRSNMLTAMAKMSGRDLGKLYMKDMATVLSLGTGAYTGDDFMTLVNKINRSDRHEFWGYHAAAGQIFHMTTIGWWIAATIRERVLIIEALLDGVRYASTEYATSRMAMYERLRHGDDDPWEMEVVARESADLLQKTFIDRAEGIAKHFEELSQSVKAHKALTAAMAVLAETVQIPEIASIPNDPMPNVESLNEWLRELKDPYRDIFPEIDMDSLEPSQEDIDAWITRANIEQLLSN